MNDNSNQPQDSDNPEPTAQPNPQGNDKTPTPQRSNLRSRLKRPSHLQPKKETASGQSFAFGEVSDVSSIKEGVTNQKEEAFIEEISAIEEDNSESAIYSEEVIEIETEEIEIPISENRQQERKERAPFTAAASSQDRYDRVERKSSEPKEYAPDHSKYKRPAKTENKSFCESPSRNRTEQTSSSTFSSSYKNEVQEEKGLFSKIISFIRSLFGGKKRTERASSSSQYREGGHRHNRHRSHSQDRRHDGKRGGHRYGKNRRPQGSRQDRQDRQEKKD